MSDIKGTKKAFKELIQIRGIYAHLGQDRHVVNKWKRMVELKNKYPTEDTMRKLLQTAGARVVQEVVWRLPNL
jgi:hypothetical protein